MIGKTISHYKILDKLIRGGLQDLNRGLTQAGIPHIRMAGSATRK